MAYIDRESLKLKVRRYLMPNVDDDGTVQVENAERYFLKLLEDEPTADVVEVRHGEWIYDHWCEFGCSICGHWSKTEPRGEENFCSNCGAKMDGGKNENV